MVPPTIKQELVGAGMTDDESGHAIDALGLLGFTEPGHFARLNGGIILQHHNEGDIAARNKDFIKLTTRICKKVVASERAAFVGLLLQDKIIEAMKSLLDAHFGEMPALSTAPAAFLPAHPNPFALSIDGEQSITTNEVDGMVRGQRKFAGQSTELDLSDTVNFAAVKHCMRCIKSESVKKGERAVMIYLKADRGCTEFESRSRQRERSRPDSSVISQIVAASTEDAACITDYSIYGSKIDQLTRFRLDLQRVSVAWVTAGSFFIPTPSKDTFQRSGSDIKMLDSSDGETKYVFGTLKFTTLLMGRFEHTLGITSPADVEPAIRSTYAAVGTELSQGLMLNSSMKEGLRNTSLVWQMIRGPEALPSAAENSVAGSQLGGNVEILEYLKSMASNTIDKNKKKKDKKLKPACPDFNKAAGCKNKSHCPNGVHRCTKCKAGGHGASNCKN